MIRTRDLTLWIKCSGRRELALLGVMILLGLPGAAQTASSSVTARDLAGWYATHEIDTGHVVVLDRPATVRKTPGVSESSGEVMLDLYEIDIDNATFRLTMAMGVESGKPLDYFAVQQVTPEKLESKRGR
jgi:hypothetical protein